MDDGEAMTMKEPMPQDDSASHDDKVPEPPDASDDDFFLDFDLPSIDAHAARLAEHPAWPWVTVSMEGGDGAVVVDYGALSMG